jgi:hypothetical protein
MKQTFEGWTVALQQSTVSAKISKLGIIKHTYFMGTHKTYSGNKYVTLEAYPTHINVLKNLHKTKEDAIDFWNTGMWDLSIDRESVSVVPVKINIDIDVSCLGLDWNGM